MKNLLFIILGFLFLTSCVTKTKEDVIKKDTITQVVIKDSIVSKKDTTIKSK